MRALALGLTSLTACVVGPAAASIVALSPVAAPIALGGEDRGQGSAEIAFHDVGGDSTRDVRGGWGLGVRSNGFLSFSDDGLLGVAMYGRLEAGAFGRDRIYGIDGGSVGPGLRLGNAGFLGVGIGYEYGGYPQNGHDVLTRAQLVLHAGGLGMRASLYGAWRMGVRDEYPAATSHSGVGWNASGGDLALSLNGKVQGLALGIGFDRQDDIRAGTVFIGGALSKH
jgi:hypothetical protein